MHTDNKNKGTFTLSEGPTDGLHKNTFTAEKEYSINSTELQKKFYVSLHYNRGNSHIFFNSVEIYKFKLKDSEINATLLCFGNVSQICL